MGEWDVCTCLVKRLTLLGNRMHDDIILWYTGYMIGGSTVRVSWQCRMFSG